LPLRIARAPAGCAVIRTNSATEKSKWQSSKCSHCTTIGQSQCCLKGVAARATVTSELGEFTILVSPNETIVISSIGFETRELKYTNQVVLNIQLKKQRRSCRMLL
jgi:hypothetical protein